MKFFQKTWVAVVITLAMVAGAVFIGLNRTDTVPNTPASVGLDTSLSTSRSEGFLLDEADVLSQEEEHQINLYNANWLERYDSLIAVAVVPSASGSLEDYAYERAMAWELAAAADGPEIADFLLYENPRRILEDRPVRPVLEEFERA